MTTTLSRPQRLILATLAAAAGPIPLREIVRLLDHGSPASVSRSTNVLINRGLLTYAYERRVGFVYSLTSAGRQVKS